MVLIASAANLLAVEWPAVQLERAAAGLTNPVAIAHAGDGSGRIFIAEQAGRIRVVENGRLLEQPLLDITDRVTCCGERGLLGLVFPPGYAQKNHFYVFYTDRNGDLVISRFQGDSETILLTIPHREFENHNGGQIAFGPDGYLFIGTGDGGGSGDTLGNSQNPRSLLGKLLRLDVESANPSPEIWALGLRNPWRFSFDRETGDLYIGDVGQDRWEEINFQPAGSKAGEDFGWNIREGRHCYEPTACAQESRNEPIAEYDHDSGGCSVTGGYVYRGQRHPAWRGFYFYGDYCNGKLWALTRDGGEWQTRLVLETGVPISTFGEDEEGNLYLAAHDRGEIYRLSQPDYARAAFTTGTGTPGLISHPSRPPASPITRMASKNAATVKPAGKLYQFQ